LEALPQLSGFLARLFSYGDRPKIGSRENGRGATNSLKRSSFLGPAVNQLIFGQGWGQKFHMQGD
jgi:hypothetical protein